MHIHNTTFLTFSCVILSTKFIFVERREAGTMELKDEIRTRRKELRMSQYDLAFELIVSPSTVYRWETGSSKPNYRKILAMAKIFGVDKRELLNALKETEDNKKDVH